MNKSIVYKNNVLPSSGEKTYKTVSKALNFAGSPGKIGLGLGILSFLPAWLIMRMTGHNHSLLKAAGIATAAGAAGTILTHPISPKKGNKFSDKLLGSPSLYEADWRPEENKTPTIKTAADYMANLPNTDKLTLHDLVDNVPGFTPPQRNFLHNGIYNAPTSSPNVFDLANGFTGTVNNVTGGLLPVATRAIEGALIGSAFGSVLGVKPGTKKFITGATTMVNSLWGNNLFNTIPKVY